MATKRQKHDARSQPVEHGDFAGLVNVVPEDELELSDLLVAQNVNIDDKGKISRRSGHSAALSGLDGSCRSLWSDGEAAFVVQDDELVEIMPDLSAELRRSGLTPGRDMAFTRLAGRTFYSNGVERGCVENSVDRSWGLEPPSSPGVASTVGGALPAGRYQFVVTFLRADLQESGASVAGSVDVAEGEGIQLSNLPLPADPGVAWKSIYFTHPNGETFYRAGLILDTDTSFLYALLGPATLVLRTQHLRPPPAGDFVDLFNGRTLVAKGNTLWHSEPWSLELFDLRKNFSFRSPIVALAALEDGVWVMTDDVVVWLNGRDPAQWTYSEKLQYGGLRGAATRCAQDEVTDNGGDTRVALLGTKQGMCIGFNGGTINNLSHDRFIYPEQERGAVLFRNDQQGLVQMVLSAQGVESS